MRKNIARKLAMLLALVVLVTTCGSDYNSILVNATTEEAISEFNEQADSTEEDYSSLFTEQIGEEQLVDKNQQAAAQHDTRAQQPRTPITKDKLPGRNDPCPCGSGKKFKNCHGKGIV